LVIKIINFIFHEFNDLTKIIKTNQDKIRIYKKNSEINLFFILEQFKLTLKINSLFSIIANNKLNDHKRS
jgi:hypothetical protein